MQHDLQTKQFAYHKYLIAFHFNSDMKPLTEEVIDTPSSL